MEVIGLLTSLFATPAHPQISNEINHLIHYFSGFLLGPLLFSREAIDLI
jgi:hypothetical protein